MSGVDWKSGLETRPFDWQYRTPVANSYSTEHDGAGGGGAKSIPTDLAKVLLLGPSTLEAT